MGQEENELTKKILRYLGLKGCTVWRQNVGRFQGAYKSGIPGLPDILGFTSKGQFIGIEVKSSTGNLRSSQVKFQEKAVRCGSIYLVARRIEDVMEVI